MKYYILMERCFEYNDEYHYPTGGGSPCQVFTDKEIAEKVCLKANFDWLSSDNRFNDYIRYDGSCLVDDLVEAGFLTEKQAEEVVEWDGAHVDFLRLAPKEGERLVELCKEGNLWGYEVVEVEG